MTEVYSVSASALQAAEERTARGAGGTFKMSDFKLNRDVCGSLMSSTKAKQVRPDPLAFLKKDILQ